MKLNIIIVLSIFLAISFNIATGQGIVLSPPVVQIQSTEFNNVYGKTYMHNQTTDTVFTWELIDIDAPEGWLVAICDPELCTDPGTQFHSFRCHPDSFAYISATVYPLSDTISGTAEISLKLYSNTKPNEQEILTFSISYTFYKPVTFSEEIEVYPNPASNYLFLEGDESLEDLVIEIIDNQGMIQYIRKYSNERKLSISVDGMSKGLYYIRIQKNGKWSAVNRLLLQ